jgi:hypothetical protein
MRRPHRWQTTLSSPSLARRASGLHQDRQQLRLELRMSSGGCRVHVPNTLPHLVEQILAETAAAFEQRLELRRLGGRGRASALPQGYRRFRAPHRHQSRSPIELSKLPNAADSSQCADEPDVPDRVCELRSPRRLQVRQQVELTPVVGTMMRAA